MYWYPIDKTSSVPLYVQVANIITENIRNGYLPEGTLIPSESQLMDHYNVSRITVRNAMLRLEYQGDIFKVHGRGSFVAPKKFVEVPSPTASFEEQMRRQGITVSQTLIEFSKVFPNEQVKTELRLTRNKMVTKVKRLNKIGSQTIGMDVLFFPQDIGRGLDGKDLSNISLLEYLNSRPETKVAFMEVQVRAAVIEDGDAEVMAVDNSSTVLIRQCVFSNSLGRPVMSGKFIYLSQYALIKMVINAESTSLGVSVGDMTGAFM